MHPKTGKVCVPFDPVKVDEFDPNECPTLNQCLNQYDRICAQKDFDKNIFSTVPALEEPMRVFKEFLRGTRAESARLNRKVANEVDEMDVQASF